MAAAPPVAGAKAPVVQRYDRVVHPDGSVQRLHQEDFCQATGVPPDRKYQEDGGPSLMDIAEILQTVAPAAATETLLRAVVLNVLIGNGDAHAKNFSLLHNPPDALGLAPLYDLMSTLYYGDERLAMYIDSVQRTRRVTADRILSEALERLRLQVVHVDQIVTGTMEAVEEAGSKLRQTVWGPIVKATALVRGIQTGLEFFRAVRQGREPAEPPSDRWDEGMFV